VAGLPLKPTSTEPTRLTLTKRYNNRGRENGARVGGNQQVSDRLATGVDCNLSCRKKEYVPSVPVFLRPRFPHISHECPVKLDLYDHAFKCPISKLDNIFTSIHALILSSRRFCPSS
jgi:hypothetical protein